jgi:hypothetical protein
VFVDVKSDVTSSCNPPKSESTQRSVPPPEPSIPYAADPPHLPSVRGQRHRKTHGAIKKGSYPSSSSSGDASSSENKSPSRPYKRNEQATDKNSKVPSGAGGSKPLPAPKNTLHHTHHHKHKGDDSPSPPSSPRPSDKDPPPSKQRRRGDTGDIIIKALEGLADRPAPRPHVDKFRMNYHCQLKVRMAKGEMATPSLVINTLSKAKAVEAATILAASRRPTSPEDWDIYFKFH